MQLRSSINETNQHALLKEVYAGPHTTVDNHKRYETPIHTDGK